MSKRVMIVDDEKEIVKLLEEFFEKEGFRTISAYNGEEALHKVVKSKPDIVILDIMMPEVCGWELLDFIKTNPQTSHIPVIVLTAKGREISRVYGLEHGADDYVVKPFGLKELLIRVKRTIEKSSTPHFSPGSISKIPIVLGDNLVFIEKEEISAVKAVRKESIVYFKKDEYRSRYNIGSLQEMLGKQFYRVHKSYLVNISKIKKALLPEANKMYLIIELGYGKEIRIPVSRKQISTLKKMLNIGRMKR